MQSKHEQIVKLEKELKELQVIVKRNDQLKVNYKKCGKPFLP